MGFSSFLRYTILIFGTESPGHFVLPPKTMNFGLKASISLSIIIIIYVCVYIYMYRCTFIYIVAQSFPEITNFWRRDLQFWIFSWYFFLSFSLWFFDSDGEISETTQGSLAYGSASQQWRPCLPFHCSRGFSPLLLLLLPPPLLFVFFIWMMRLWCMLMLVLEIFLSSISVFIGLIVCWFLWLFCSFHGGF